MFRKLPAYHLYLIIQVTFGLFFTMMSMISAIYRVQTVGLNPLQLVLVGTVLEGTVFLFEVPTGIVADIYSRRLSVILGYLLIGLGFILEGALALFPTILLAQVIWGIGATFTSGAEQAWLADEAGEERLANTYLRASQAGMIGTLIGIALSTGLGTISLNLPIILGGIGIVGLALFLALFMPETGFTPAVRPERQTWRKVGATFREGLQVVRGRPALRLMLAVSVIYGLSSEGLDRLWEAHLLANFDFPTAGNFEPVVWFGMINIVQLFLVIGATEIMRRRLAVEDQRTAVRALLILNILVVIGVVLFGLAGSFTLAVAAIWGVFVFRNLSGPLYEAWLNKGLQPEVRATVLSMRGQLDAVGQVAGGPIIGVMAVRLGLRAAMVGVGLMLSPAVAAYGLVLRLLGKEQAGYGPKRSNTGS